MDSRNVILCMILTLILLAGTLAEGEVRIRTISKPSGTLEYPVNSETYTGTLNYQWIFIAPEDLVVELTFTNINFHPPISGTCLDAIAVYDGGPGTIPAMSRFCGDGPFWPVTPRRFLSTTNKLSVTMILHGIYSGSCFVAEFKHVPPRTEFIAAINVEDPSILLFNRFSTRLSGSILLSHSFHPSALDFDPITEYFYYTDIHFGFIGRIKYGSGSDKVLITQNVQTPLGVAVGYLTGLMYWTDLGRNEVSVSRLDGTFRKTLMFSNAGCSSPRGITLSADQLNIFWTCAQKIMKAKADGSEGQTLVDGLNDPIAIVLDKDMFLYWVDRNTLSVGRIKTDGSMRDNALLTAKTFARVHSFAMDSFAYYWWRAVDKDFIHVAREDITRNGDLTLAEKPVTMKGLYYFKSDVTIPQQHTCTTGRTGCQELCFPRETAFSCVKVTPTIENCPNWIKVYTRQLKRQVFWKEPSAISHTSNPDGQRLDYYSRTSWPGSTFKVGGTTVNYTFKDGLGNTAICSFKVVIVLGTNKTKTTKTLNETTVTTRNTVIPIGGIAVLLCIAILIVGCIVG